MSTAPPSVWVWGRLSREKCRRESTSRHDFIAAAQTSIVSGVRKSRKVTEMSGQVDYSLYLVTDSTDAILGSRDLVDVVEKALQGGRLHFPLSLCTP
jgi:hypothetical protein